MSASIPQKFCMKCKQWKPATPEYFYRKADAYDGLSMQCKSCKKATSDKRLQTAKAREARRRSTEKWRKTEKGRRYVRAKQERREKRAPEKIAAKHAVREAVKRGILPNVKDCRCQYCGKQASDYHHWSYAPENRLDVVPLCRRCHNEIHGLVFNPHEEQLALWGK